ncbi:MAG: DNA polymerase Y family protein [Betaproteobacteria bacterium]|nr:DNA polymerase Y family protein [Betaproteobacteria bacterium]
MLWAALLSPCLPNVSLPPREARLREVATWALQFAPRVAIVEEAILLEVQASLRLFGGWPALRHVVREQASAFGVQSIAWAPTGLGALALAKAGIQHDDGGEHLELGTQLDALPLETLSAVHAHAPTLSQLGCRTLGDVRNLPRGGLSRRFGQAMLCALDQAYGLRPEHYSWFELPESFSAQIELMARVETAPALLFGSRRLLLQLGGWLVARHCGVTTFTLRWTFDPLRPRDAGTGGELVIRTASPMRDVDHLTRLLGENLAKLRLAAPVERLELLVDDVQPYSPPNHTLVPDTQHDRQSLTLTLERIASRLGESRVLRPVLAEDARPEWAQRWQPASIPLAQRPAATDGMPHPTFLLPKPLQLSMRNDRPIYQGELQLLLGPHRIEGGWWHRVEEGGQTTTRHVSRDYWVALSAHAGVLWVFQTRQATDKPAWFLHGLFA